MWSRPSAACLGASLRTASSWPISGSVHEFEFRFDVDFVRRALRRDYLWRGWLVAGAFFVVTTIVFRGVYGVFVPMLVGASALGSLIIGYSYHVKLRRYAARICELWEKQSPSGTIRYCLDDEGFQVQFDQAQSRFEWASLRKLWCYPDAWLLEVVKMQSVFFPPEGTPAAALAFIQQRCEAAGVPIKAKIRAR